MSILSSAQETQKVLTRRNIAGYDPDGPDLKALKHGIQVMKDRSLKDPKDPRGWIYQTAIHGTYLVPEQEMWNQCQHKNPFFLSWHRMYLYFFERILREASGDRNLTLSYWDFTNKASRALPKVFLQPASADNPLYTTERSDQANGGGELPEKIANTDLAMSLTSFTDRDASVGDYGFSRQLEETPHSHIHTAIGGYMADPRQAALDPVFFFYHANIDRQWSKWLALGQGRADPSDEMWLRQQRYVFYDADGEQVWLTGEQIIDTAKQLSYRYDDDSEPQQTADRTGTYATHNEGGRALVTIGATQGNRTRFAESITNVRLNISPEAKTLLAKKLQSEPNAFNSRAVLILDDIVVDTAIEGYFEVYLDLPTDVRPDPTASAFVGLVSFFGVLPEGHAHEPSKRLLPVNSSRLLFKNFDSADASVQLTFVRRGMELPSPKPVRPLRGTPSIGSISLAVK
jgi:tyrosinase